jgi:hypothetical protein
MAPRLLRAAAVVGGLAVAAALARRAAPRIRARTRGGTRPAAPPGTAAWHCACGQAYRVTGLDRHRVYWLEGADERDAVLGGACPACGRPLPAASVAHPRPAVPS